MAEYIKRSDAIGIVEEIRDDHESRRYSNPFTMIIDSIGGVPAADVRPVVRGRWVGYPECLKYTNAYSDDHIVCSVCEECFSILDNDYERFKYCPNCGAKMEG